MPAKRNPKDRISRRTKLIGSSVLSESTRKVYLMMHKPTEILEETSQGNSISYLNYIIYIARDHQSNCQRGKQVLATPLRIHLLVAMLQCCDIKPKPTFLPLLKINRTCLYLFDILSNSNSWNRTIWFATACISGISGSPD